MPGIFPRPLRLSGPDMHQGKCVPHMPWCMPGSLISGFFWSQWREKRPRHSRRMHNPQFYVSDKRPMVQAPLCEQSPLSHHPAVKSTLLHPPQSPRAKTFQMALPIKSHPGWVHYRLISRQYIPCLDTAMDSQPITEASTSVGGASGILSDAGKLKWSIMND